MQRECGVLTTAAYELLASYHWPGNVRELENLMTRAMVLSVAEKIDADDLRPWLATSSPTPATATRQQLTEILRLEEMERQMIEATLERFQGIEGRRRRRWELACEPWPTRCVLMAMPPTIDPLPRVHSHNIHLRTSCRQHSARLAELEWST